MVNVECLFGDWRFSPLDESIAAFLPGSIIPLTWEGGRITPVHLSDSVADTVAYVALAAHWAQAHPLQVLTMVGPVELARYPRNTALPWPM